MGGFGVEKVFLGGWKGNGRWGLGLRKSWAVFEGWKATKTDPKTTKNDLKTTETDGTKTRGVEGEVLSWEVRELRFSQMMHSVAF